MLKIDKEVFERNLLLTQAYCEMQLVNTDNSTAEILRSFNPEYNGKKMLTYKFGEYAEVIWATNPLSSGVYDQLFEDQMLHKKNTVNMVAEGAQFKGLILVAEIDATIVDGASESISQAFIDGNDCPPIDTWFYKIQSKLGLVFYAWIPEQFVEITQNAIDVNVVECFTWEDDFVLRKEPNVPYHYTYQTKFPPAEKHKNTLFWILGFALLIRLIAYMVEKITK